LFYFIFSDLDNLKTKYIENTKTLKEMREMKERYEIEIKDLEKIKDTAVSINTKQKEVEGNNNFFRFFRKV
jgi:hypothetical protein